ncbi:MAG: hypothetical protein H0V45_04405 [Actinobacteria bacterium]|nr:hypothetical protein [Actinomycetota bacterium]
MSVPAEVRSRWETDKVSVEDHGDHLVVRPLPVDPVAAFRGAFTGGRSSDELRAISRLDDQAAERRRK